MSQATESPEFFKSKDKCLTGANVSVFMDMQPEMRMDRVFEDFTGNLDAPNNIPRGGSAGIVFNVVPGHTHEYTCVIRGHSIDTVAMLQRGLA